LNNASVQARLSQRLFTATPTSLGLNDLVIIYTTQHSSQVEPTLNVSGKIVQLGQLVGLSNDIWRLRFSHFPFRNPIIFNSSTDKTLVISVPSVSEYKIPISSDSESGFLCQHSNGTEFPLSATWNLFPTGYFVPLPSQTFSGSSHFPHSSAISRTNGILASLFSKSSQFHDSVSSVSSQFDKSSTFAVLVPQLSARLVELALLSNSLLVSSSQFADSVSHLSLHSGRTSICLLSTAATTTQTDDTPSASEVKLNIALIIGLSVGLFVVVLVVIGALLLKRMLCQAKVEHSHSDSPPCESSFVDHTLNDTTFETVYHDSLTYEESSDMQAIPNSSFPPH
jgi:hypothetical protein